MNADRFVVVYENGVPAAILQEAFHVIQTDEVNAESTLEFELYFTDPKRGFVKNQAEVRLGGQAYKVKTVTDKKESGAGKITSVYAENLYYDLARAARLETAVFDVVKAGSAMRFALQNTSWDIGIVGISATRSFESDADNPLALLQLIADVYHGELVFHPVEKTVDLVKQTGGDNGMVFHFKKNMKSIERTVSTTSLITRLYAFGKDGMTFASVNGGLSYVEDHSYTDELLIGSLDCSNSHPRRICSPMRRCGQRTTVSRIIPTGCPSCICRTLQAMDMRDTALAMWCEWWMRSAVWISVHGSSAWRRTSWSRGTRWRSFPPPSGRCPWTAALCRTPSTAW